MYWIICIFIHYKLVSLFLFVSFIISTVSSLHSHSAVCFLTRQPSFETVQFALQLFRNIPTLDVFIVVDNNTAIIPLMTLSTVRFLRVEEDVCRKYGFQQANTFGAGKNCSAWDKALYYFSKLVTDHSFVWFIEDDVFIPSTQAFLALHELYSSTYDLVSTDFEYNINGTFNGWYHWRLAPATFVLPWAQGMVCAIGCSRRLLSAVKEYAQWRGHLVFIEILFHTLVSHDNRMKVVTPVELDTILYRETYTYERIQSRPNNWWHPVKNFTRQGEWRSRLMKKSSVDQNNSLIEFTTILKQINMKGSIYDVQNQMNDLLVKFELVKSQITSSNRRQLRDEFLRFANNRSDNLTSLAILLADHAVKLSHVRLNTSIQQNKTINHINLEKAIEDNKNNIRRLMKNENPSASEMITVDQLRFEVSQLILQLTREIRCEQGVVRCNKSRAWFLPDYKVNLYRQKSFTNQLISLIIVLLCIIFIVRQLIRRKCLC